MKEEMKNIAIDFSLYTVIYLFEHLYSHIKNTLSMKLIHFE